MCNSCEQDFLITELDWDNPDSLFCLDEPVIDIQYFMWKEKRETDIKYCGYVASRENGASGKNSNYHNFCHEPDCPYCGPRIREEMRLALEERIKDKSLRLVKLTGDDKTLKKERAKLVRKYGGKEKVSVFCNEIVTENGIQNELEILIDTDDEIGEEYIQVQTSDIERWSQKTFTFKKSGNLHKLENVILAGNNEPDEEEPREVFQLQKWTVETKDKELLDKLELQVIYETSHLNPKTFDELYNAIIERRAKRKQIFERNDIVILSNDSFYSTIRLSDINWQKYNDAAVRLVENSS